MLCIIFVLCCFFFVLNSKKTAIQLLGTPIVGNLHMYVYNWTGMRSNKPLAIPPPVPNLAAIAFVAACVMERPRRHAKLLWVFCCDGLRFLSKYMPNTPIDP
jgi:uncharacterized membrane protein YwaF